MTEFLNSTTIGTGGQKTLPASYYLSEEIYQLEQRAIFAKRWICAGRSELWNKPGAYRLISVDGESIIVVADQQGEIQAYYNVCRHRGTRLCTEVSGELGKTIQCPYHAWTYALDGRLVGVPDEKHLSDFCRDDHSLHRVASVQWEGFVWLNLGGDKSSFAEDFAPLIGKFKNWGLESLVAKGSREYQVRANWKLIVQNYSECYHCAPVHPMLVKLSPPTSGGNDLIEGAFLGGYMDVTEPGGSLTCSGRACGPVVGPLPSIDLQRVYYYYLFPNVFLSLHHDYVMVHRLWPQGARLTRVECEWLFREEEGTESQYDPQDGVLFWDKTNQEDWHMSELSQLGIASRVYQPGPYSGREAMSAAFDRYYLSVINPLISSC